MKDNSLNKQDNRENIPMPVGMDLELLWDKIEDRRNKKKRRRALFIIPLFMGLALVGFLLYGFLSEEPVKEITVVASIETPSTFDQKNSPNNKNKSILAPLTEKETQNDYPTSLRKEDLSLNLFSPIQIADIKSKEQIHNPEETIVRANTTQEKRVTKSLVASKDDHEPRSQDLVENILTPFWNLQSKPLERPNLTMAPAFVPFKKHFILNFDLMGGIAFNSLESYGPATEKNEEYILSRNQSENSLEHLGGQLTLISQLSQSFFLEFGLRVSSSVSRFSDTYSQQSNQLMTVDSSITFVYLDGQSGQEAGEINVKTIETYLKAKHNRYTSVGIPFSVGLRKSLSRKLDLSISTGLVYNWTLVQNGLIKTEDPQLSGYKNLNESEYRTTDLWQSTSSLLLSYEWQNNWYLRCGINYQADLNSRLVSPSYKDHFQSLNLNIGIAHKL